MKNKAVVFVILVCTTTFLAGCEELPNGDCWPAELSKCVPLGVIVALEIALSPIGIINGMLESGVDPVICDDIQNVTYGPAYQEVHLNKEILSASLEDILIFQDKYIFELYCHEQGMSSVEVGEWFGVWSLNNIAGSRESLATLENYLGPDFTDCTRGYLNDLNWELPDLNFDIDCAIVTDKQGITRFYPLSPDEPIWGNTEGKGTGEFSLTKEEFSEWYYNVYVDYQG